MKWSLLAVVALCAGCGGGGGASPVTRNIEGGTWDWSFYETPAGTRTGCTGSASDPAPCGQQWEFSGGQMRPGPGAVWRPYSLVGSNLTFFDPGSTETTTFRWISDNEFAERRIGNTDWEIWRRP